MRLINSYYQALVLDKRFDCGFNTRNLKDSNRSNITKRVTILSFVDD